ncbi:MAG: hypothetical protein QOG25_262 [Acetobacteraceae bacterium]|jgi:hypothetical protein|nr:hypothetical protein [Acetobacteraceae bacterium]
MVPREHYKLVSTAVEKRVGADHKRAGMLLIEGGERSIDLRFGASLQDVELHPLRGQPPGSAVSCD